MAYERLSEAELLCNHGKYDGAFYLAGYSIELMLKAKVCEHLGIDNLFDEKPQTVVHGVSDVRKAVKTHDIAVLLIFAGLRIKFGTDKSENKVLEQTNTRLFDASGHCTWNEQIRYQPIGSQIAKDVQELVELLQHEKGLLQWIEKS